MSSRTYGYIRVSTKEQNLDRQRVALEDYGVEAKNIVEDKLSGKNFNREGYLYLKNTLLREGDTLVIKELDRLGRNYEMIKEEWSSLVEMGVNIEIIDMPILNTKEKSSLEKNLISNIVFEILAYISQQERDKIRQRQAEGIAAMPTAEIDGKLKKVSKKTMNPIGRPELSYPKNWVGVYKRWKSEDKDIKITARKAMQELNLAKTSFYNLVRRYEEEVANKGV
ncbi:MAG: recombinase family protein [Romboutsia timonensis]|nr:recombinase family protein [Romboutsia timonensis]